MKNRISKTKQPVVFCKQGSVESLIIGGNRPVEDPWTGSACKAIRSGWRTLSGVEMEMPPICALLGVSGYRQYNVQAGGGEGKCMYTVVYVHGTKPGRGIDHGGGRAGAIDGKEESRGRTEAASCAHLR